VLEHNKGTDDLTLVGIRSRGVHLAQRLQAKIRDIEGVEVPTGIIDITLYRDDLSRSRQQPEVRGTQIPFDVDDKRVVLPPKETAYGSIEGLMNHFMLIMEGYGIRPPAGEAYFPVEGANGELGFYVVSDGSDRPYRVRCRPPCLPPLAALHRMIVGEMVADMIPTFGSVNMIGGELDR